MKITKIKKLKNKVVVTFEDATKLEIAENVYPNFYLYVGKDVAKKELNKIKDYASSAALMEYALKLRSKSLYSEHKMREKLYNKGGEKPVVDLVIKRLKENDLIDDNALLEDYIEYYNSLNYGKNKIKDKVLSKGIFLEKVEKIHFSSSLERKKANNIFDKVCKKFDKCNNLTKKRKVYEAYLNLGFDVDIAKEMSDKVKESSPKEENNKLEKDFEKVYLRYARKYPKKELRIKLLNYLTMKGYRYQEVVKMIERKGL